MRITKIGFILFFSLFFIILSACAKDSVQSRADPSPSKTHAVAHSKQQTSNKIEETHTVNPNQYNHAKTSKPTNEQAQKQPVTNNETSSTKTSPKQIQPSPPPAPTKEKVAQGTVQVIGYQGKTILAATMVPLHEGDMALGVTQSILKAIGISMSVRGSGSGAYVEGIDNEFEFDHGPTSGWIFEVNGKIIGISAGSYLMSEGDHLIWKYSTKVLGGHG